MEITEARLKTLAQKYSVWKQANLDSKWALQKAVSLGLNYSDAGHHKRKAQVTELAAIVAFSSYRSKMFPLRPEETKTQRNDRAFESFKQYL